MTSLSSSSSTSSSFADRVSRLSERELLTHLWALASVCGSASADGISMHAMARFVRRFALDVDSLSALCTALGCAVRPHDFARSDAITRPVFRSVVRALCASGVAGEVSQRLPDALDAAQIACSGASYAQHVAAHTLIDQLGEISVGERALLAHAFRQVANLPDALSAERALSLLRLHESVDDAAAARLLALVSPLDTKAPLRVDQFVVAFFLAAAAAAELPSAVSDAVWASARVPKPLKRSAVTDALLKKYESFGFDDLFLDVSEDVDGAVDHQLSTLVPEPLLSFELVIDVNDDTDVQSSDDDATQELESERRPKPLTTSSVAANSKSANDDSDDSDDGGDDDDDDDDSDDKNDNDTVADDDDGDDDDTFSSSDEQEAAKKSRSASVSDEKSLATGGGGGDTLMAGMSEFLPSGARDELALPVLTGVTLPFVEGSLRPRLCKICNTEVDLAPLLRSSVPHTGVPLVSALPMRPVARGVLLKRGAFVKNLKQRFFVLAGQHLCYYQSSGALTTAAPLGVIHLDRTCSVDANVNDQIAKLPKGFTHAFALHAHERTWQFFCKTAQERELWVAALRWSCQRRVEAPLCLYCRQVIDLATEPRVLLSAPLRCLSPLSSLAVRAVFVAGHLLLFTRSEADLVWNESTVPSGRPLACVHLHRAKGDRRTSTVFEISEAYDAAIAGTTQFVVTPRNPRTAKDRKVHLYAFEIVDGNGDPNAEHARMTRVANALRFASTGGDVPQPEQPVSPKPVAAPADSPLIDAPPTSPASRVSSHGRPTGSSSSSSGGGGGGGGAAKVRPNAATLAGIAAAAELVPKAAPPASGAATDEQLPTRRNSKSHTSRKASKAPRDDDDDAAKSPSSRAKNAKSPRAAAPTAAPTSTAAAAADTSVDPTMSSMTTVDATRIELFRLERGLSSKDVKAAAPAPATPVTPPTRGRPSLRRVSARSKVTDASDDPDQLPPTKRRDKSQPSSPAVAAAPAVTITPPTAAAAVVVAAAAATAAAPAASPKAAAGSSSKARATTAPAPPTSPPPTSTTGELNARMYFDSSDEEDDAKKTKIREIKIRDKSVGDGEDDDDDALNAFLSPQTITPRTGASPRAAASPLTSPAIPPASRARGRKNADKRLTFSDLGRNAYLLGSVGMKVDDVDPNTGAQKATDDEPAEEEADGAADDGQDAAAARAAKKAKREARSRARSKKDAKKKEKEKEKDGEKKRSKSKCKTTETPAPATTTTPAVATDAAAAATAVVAPAAAREQWFFVGEDNRQHAFAPDVRANIERAWSEKRFGERVEVDAQNYVVVYAVDDVRQFSSTTQDLLGVLVERESDGGVERSSRYPTTLPPSLHRQATGVSAASKPGGIPSPVLRAMREQRQARQSKHAAAAAVPTTTAAATVAAGAAASSATGEVGAMSALTIHLPPDASGIERQPVRVMVRDSTAYAELCRRLIKACADRGVECSASWLVYVVSLESGETIGCLADLEDTLKPRACDQQLRDEGVKFKYVFRPDEAEPVVVEPTVVAAVAVEPAAAVSESVAEVSEPVAVVSVPPPIEPSPAAADGNDDDTEGSMSGRGDEPRATPPRTTLMTSTLTAADDGDESFEYTDDDEAPEGDADDSGNVALVRTTTTTTTEVLVNEEASSESAGEEEEEEEEEDDDDSGLELNSDDSSLSDGATAGMTATQQFARGMLLLERGAFVRSAQRIDKTLALLGEVAGEVESARDVRVAQIRVCAQYAQALKLLVLIRDTERSMRSVSDASETETLTARVAYLSLVLASIQLAKPAHRLVCVRMAVARNVSARNYGVVATHVQALRKLLVAMSTYGDAEQADVKAKMEQCRVEQFRNYGMALHCGGLSELPSDKFAPAKFCALTFVPLDESLGFIEQVSCTLCDAHLKDDDGALVGNVCPLCRRGTLG
jgi:hypothetical protein